MGRRLIHKKGIRSTILAAIAAVLATIALVVGASGNNSALAATSLNNGNFETGDLTGWSVDTTNGGTARALSGYSYFSCGLDWWCGHVRFMGPKEGSYFALLQTGKESEDTIFSQPFEASNGDKVSGWVFLYNNFWPDHQYPPYSEDKGQVVVKSDSGTTLATPFEQSIISGGYPYWEYWEYTFSGLTGTDTFQIEARVQRSPSSSSGTYSHMGLDDVKTSTFVLDTTKPSTSATPSVEPNAAGWNKQNVTVRLNATDNQGGSGVQKITYAASGAQTIAQTDAPGDSVEIALDQEGTTTLTYFATDKAANVEDKKSLTIKIDKRAPTGSVTINDGASRTRSRSVTLTLGATDPSAGGSGVSQMRINNTQSGLSSAPWEPYSTTKAWTLSSGQGTKTVYVQYRDGAGNLSGVVTDTIRFAR